MFSAQGTLTWVAKVVITAAAERQLSPHVRHLTPAQRMAGLEMEQFGRVEWPVWGDRAAVPRLSRKLDDRAEANIASSASGGFVRSAVIRHMKMLRDARMAGLVKPRCSVGPCRQPPRGLLGVPSSRSDCAR